MGGRHYVAPCAPLLPATPPTPPAVAADGATSAGEAPSRRAWAGGRNPVGELRMVGEVRQRGPQDIMARAAGLKGLVQRGLQIGRNTGVSLGCSALFRSQEAVEEGVDEDAGADRDAEGLSLLGERENVSEDGEQGLTGTTLHRNELEQCVRPKAVGHALEADCVDLFHRNRARACGLVEGRVLPQQPIEGLSYGCSEHGLVGGEVLELLVIAKLLERSQEFVGPVGQGRGPQRRRRQMP